MNEGDKKSILSHMNDDLASAVEHARQAMVAIRNGRLGAGAGTIWHPDGLILTNAHVAGRTRVEVTLPDGTHLPAKVLVRDRYLDLAALAVEASELPAVELGESQYLRPGEVVLALGHPWGVRGAATLGVVIGVGEPPEMRTNGRPLIQVSLHLRPGHSGGPLVDIRGRLMGVNTMMSGPDVGLAIPVQTVVDFLKTQLGLRTT